MFVRTGQFSTLQTFLCRDHPQKTTANESERLRGQKTVTHIHTNAHKNKHAHSHAQKHSHAHTHTHTHTQTHTHTHRHRHTHRHTHTDTFPDESDACCICVLYPSTWNALSAWCSALEHSFTIGDTL